MLRPLRRRASGGAIVQRVAQLENLPVAEPVQMAIWGTRQDAWTRYPRQVVGRVWLIRRTDESTPPAEAKIDAFSAVCPHLGCAIQRDADSPRFTCPCHKAFFKTSGEKVASKELGYINPTPRDMDSLPCRVVQDEAAGAWWVEVEYEKFEHGLTTKVPIA